jgi:hypothetical protein
MPVLNCTSKLPYRGKSISNGGYSLQSSFQIVLKLLGHQTGSVVKGVHIRFQQAMFD